MNMLDNLHWGPLHATLTVRLNKSLYMLLIIQFTARCDHTSHACMRVAMVRGVDFIVRVCLLACRHCHSSLHACTAKTPARLAVPCDKGKYNMASVSPQQTQNIGHVHSHMTRLIDSSAALWSIGIAQVALHTVAPTVETYGQRSCNFSCGYSRPMCPRTCLSSGQAGIFLFFLRYPAVILSGDHCSWVYWSMEDVMAWLGSGKPVLKIPGWMFLVKSHVKKASTSPNRSWT